MRILVCGGAGYIGSHMVRHLDRSGFKVHILDNLSTGHKHNTDGYFFSQIDLRDLSALENFFKLNTFDAVMHFSAKSLVGESFIKKNEYYDNNVVGSKNLLLCMHEFGIKKFIFSSSAAIFGNPVKTLIDENHPKKPINPYGENKLEIEEYLNYAFDEFNISSVALRYFNAAGADPSADIGELHDPETHLIPNILNSLLYEHKKFAIYGNDYNTDDGTCIRDYIHVNDIALAHVKALDYISIREGAYSFNLGNGSGFSILDIINATEKVTNLRVNYTIQKRREGDPDRLVADSSSAQKILKWNPNYKNIEDIISTAWKWHLKIAKKT
jgi:UDP-glucose 4-epimerase